MSKNMDKLMPERKSSRQGFIQFIWVKDLEFFKVPFIFAVIPAWF